ncbi:unnamed protein product [Clonostachys rosea]|uniref:Uncharacterized protein n=1 Tax=Bionectria ochroleuca TaxID=29856 RepID=A0ABY6UR12_BIOOC|nr:unnamed protein product [Clonostachys rosea]
MNREAEDVYRSFHGSLVLETTNGLSPIVIRTKNSSGTSVMGNAILKVKGWAGKFDMEVFMDGYEEYVEDFLV